jgi:hypothetical protein
MKCEWGQNYILLANCPSRMTVKSKVVNTHTANFRLSMHDIFTKTQTRVNWAFDIFPRTLHGGGGGDFGRDYRRYGRTIPIFSVLWSVSLVRGEVYSSGHGGGERGCYRVRFVFFKY